MRREWCQIGTFEYMKLKVVIEPGDDKGYTVYVPALPGCISEGKTVREAMKNIQEAIQLYLEPVDDDFIVEKKAVVKEIEV
jgi:predicted RNase H-like HicB family nuclease